MPYRFTDTELRAILDLDGFLVHCLRTGELDFTTILRTLDHDVVGLGKRDASFVPRTSGYARKIAHADRTPEHETHADALRSE